MSDTEDFQPAGLAVRLAAMAYDWLLLGALYVCVTLVPVLLRGGVALAPGTWWYNALLLLATFAFYGWFWTHGGQTLGLRAWRLRLQRRDGRAVSWPDAMRRSAAALTLLLPPGLGLLWIVLDDRRAAWHDLLSNTAVIRLPAPAP